MAGRREARPGRLASILVAAALFVAVLSAATMALAEGPDITALQQQLYSGPVFEQKCFPCHTDISQSKSSEIIFSHGYHNLIPCSSCHTRFPHGVNGVVTQKPVMKGCWDCHGLRHGPQGALATGECQKCHRTPRERLRPKFHTADWKYKPHVAPSLKEMNTKCAMCHTLKQCDDCHFQFGISWKPDTAIAYDAEDGCEACHGNASLTKISNGELKSYQVTGVQDSAHKDLSCQACHQDFRYDDTAAPTKVWNVNAGLACASCHDHEKITKEYYGSIHGKELIKGNLETAVCSSCHGGHYIKLTKKDPVAKAELHAAAYRVCARCHKEQYDSYDDYYHGAAYKRGAADAPACWECHGSHSILPSADASSLVSAANLPKTCKECHTGSETSFTEGAKQLIHQKKTAQSENWLVQQLSKVGVKLQ